MHNFFLKIFLIVKWSVLFLFFLSLIVYFILHASLPDLDGTKNITLLNQSVKIDRDAQGIPTIHAKHRQDMSFALGYIHAQERYFQMDLLRRSASGELAELFGDGAIESDIKVKLHRFKQRAHQTLRQLPKAHYAALMSYANGVNTGIEALTNDPYQYLLLGQLPEPWEAEDSLLCIYAMYFDLNDELGDREVSLAILKDELPQEWFDFLSPKGGVWDAPMDGEKSTEAQLKIPDVKLPDDLLALLSNTIQTNQAQNGVHQAETNFLPSSNSNSLPGSNSWAIDASLTPSSAGMLANDMHLTLRVPNIWFRASWYLDDGRRITGVTLPGVPVMVAGSNESIAWGFSNSYGDWGDVTILKTNEDNTQYQTSDGWKNFELFDHLVASSSGPSREHITLETDFGPVIGKNHKGELMAHQWLAYGAQAVNLSFMELEKSKSLDEALVVAPTMGLPPQNIVIADSEGHIGWTIAGLIPKRAGHKKWQGYQLAGDYPTLTNPEKHRIWTANNRLVAGKKLSKIGFEGGDIGARAQQIRDDLMARDQFKEADLLAIQLDNRSLFLQRWQQLLLNSLESADAKIVDSPKSASQLLMIDALKTETDLRAQPDSVAYGFVRAFRKEVVKQTIGWIFDAFEQKNPDLFKRSSVDKLIEYPVWELISKRPEHLIPKGYDSWNHFILASAQKVYDETTHNGQINFAQQTWGNLHKIDIQHPLSAAIPGLGLLLNMPKSPLTGDDNMPKVLGSDFGASMRMVVSPGQEQSGIMHMPAGQSSHPLSAYYSKGHQDWVDGKASAFLPGKTKWTLELKSLE